MSYAIMVNETCKMFGKPGNPMLIKRVSHLGVKFQRYLNAYMEKESILALDHISFEVKPGEIYGLCGPIGSGKSTLIHLLATLLRPDSGELSVFGYDVVKQASQVRRQTNKVSGDTSFFKQISAIENLLYQTRVDDLNPSVNKRDVEDLLSRLGLDQETIHRPLEEMDRSCQQVINIATKILTNPRLLLLDEPFNGLAADLKSNVCSVIQNLRDTRGMTIFFTASTIQDVSILSDRTAHLEHGKIIAIEENAHQQIKGISKARGAGARV